MLNFVNIEQEVPFSEKSGMPDINYGMQYSLDYAPLDFNYYSDETITSFSAIRINNVGTIIDTTALSTSLITFDSINNRHMCDGLTNFATSLDGGTYYYLVNSKYQSEIFQIISSDVTEATFNTDSIISINGLEFFDINYDIPEQEKIGAPFTLYGSEFSTNLYPLPFEYKAKEAVTSFSMISVDTLGNELSTTALSTSLITYDTANSKHVCDGLTMYSDVVKASTYYFIVNNRYRSKQFEIFELLCPVIKNAVFSNVIEGATVTMEYDILLTGAVMSTDVELTYSFSCETPTYSETLSLLPVSQHITTTFTLPLDILTFRLTISSDICSKVYVYDVDVIQLADEFLQLYGGGNLELYGGGSLQLYE